MRHRKSGKKFSRTPSHRKAMFRNMAKSLLTHYSLRTTVVKAKSLRGVIEPLITLAKRNDLHARRQAYKVLGSHQLVKFLFDEIGPLFLLKIIHPIWPQEVLLIAIQSILLLK